MAEKTKTPEKPDTEQQTAVGQPLPKDIPPTIDAIDEFIVEHQDEPLGKFRHFLMRCINRLVNPYKEFDKNHIYDSWGYPIAKRCYASKRWMPFEGPDGVKFHMRRNHKTRLNKMTIKARKVWEAELKRHKEYKESIVRQHELGEITHSKMIALIAESADKRTTAFKNWDEGFATMEQCMEYLKKHGLLV